MLTKSFFLCFLLLLPCVFGNVRLNRKVILVSNDFETENSGQTEKYAVVFDAGSTGTRVHVFHFDSNLDLLQINGQFEIYDKVTPGLSSYATDPEMAACSIAPLLKKAADAIPTDLRSHTPVLLEATAGLRLIGEEKSEKILEAIRTLFNHSSLLYEKDGVAVISGTQEGTYMWVTVNYLLGNLGNEYSKTVGVIDLGGASMQMAYAISAQAATNAPKTGEDYVTKHFLKETGYYLYVHSYLRYGLDAARAEVLKLTNDSVNYCVLTGYNGIYKYNGASYNLRSASSGSNFEKCRENVLEVLNMNAYCEAKNCSFNGVWNGGGGAGQDNLYLSSNFYYASADDKIIDRKAGSAMITLADLKRAALAACALRSPKEATYKYPDVWTSNLPFICFDLVYQHTVLTAGFGFNEEKVVTLVNTIKYRGFNLDASWPLGSAIATLAGMPSTKPEVQNMYQFWSHPYAQ